MFAFILKDIRYKYKNIPVQVRATLWFFVCSFMQKSISMLSTPIFTRLMTPTEYGQFSIYFSWLGIITIFVSMSLTGGVYVQGLVKFEEERPVFSSSLQGLSAILTIIWTIIYVLLHNFWNKLFGLTTVQMLSMLVMIWTTAVFNFWSNEQRAEYKYKALVIITIIVSLAKPIIGVVFVVLAEDKVTARILGLLLVELVCYSGLFFVQLNRGKKFYSYKYWKYAIFFNLPLIPHYLSQIVLSSADRIMIGKMLGNSEAGIYSLAYAISSIMLLFNTALMQTLNPWIYQKIKVKKIKDIDNIGYISLVIIAIVNIFLILIAPEAVKIFAPLEYFEAIYVIPPVAMSVYYMYSYDLFAKFAFYYEKTKFIMLASVLGAVVNILLNYIFIRLFGYLAAGYTTLVCYIIYSVAHYNLMNWVCKEYCNGCKPYDVRIILAISLVFTIIGFLILLTYGYPIIRYSVIMLIVILICVEHKKIFSFIEQIIHLKNKM